MSNIGKVIKDDFCNGYFDSSHNYNLYDAVIIAEGEDWIVVRCKDGTASFCDAHPQDLIDRWCEEKE